MTFGEKVYKTNKRIWAPVGGFGKRGWRGGGQKRCIYRYVH